MTGFLYIIVKKMFPLAMVNSTTIDSAKDKSLFISMVRESLKNRPTPPCLVSVGFVEGTKI